MLKNLRYISTFVSLLMLALGFSLLGILSYLNRLQGDMAVAPGLEGDCCVAGSAISVLAGAIFFIAACFYWSRWSAGPPAARDE